jgi:ribosomal protein S18 acetylase RimI-like enzyme
LAGAGGVRVTITYRTATSEDAEQLHELFTRIFCDTFAHLYRPEDLDAFLSGFSIDGWREQLSDPAYAFRLAESDKAVGYAKVGPLKLPVEAPDRSVMLYQLYVDGAHHGAGVGKALMDWVVEEARRRDAPALYLTVFTDNHRARRFYDRYGFELAGRYEFMVGNQADEDVILKKVL